MKREKFTQQCVNNMLTEIDEHLDVDTKMRLMESCGRACAHSATIKAAEKCRGDLLRQGGFPNLSSAKHTNHEIATQQAHHRIAVSSSIQHA